MTLIVERRLPVPLHCMALGVTSAEDKKVVLDADRLKKIVRNTTTMLADGGLDVPLWSLQPVASGSQYWQHGYLAECLLDALNHHFLLRLKIVKPEGLPGEDYFVADPRFQFEYIDGLGREWGDVLASIFALHPAKALHK